MLHWGFSYVSLIFLLMLFVPNMLWTKNKPENYDGYAKNENRILGIFERIGEVLVCCTALIFADFNIRKMNLWSIWLALAVICMVCYECYWIRYFRSNKTMKDFYSSFLGMPVAGATYPVIAFLCLGIYGSNIYLIVSSVILGIGHIGIHINHRNEVTKPKKKKLIVRIIRWLVAIIFAFICLISAVIIGIRNYQYIKNHVSGEQGVEEELFVDINDQDKVIIVGHSFGTMVGCSYTTKHPDKVLCYIGAGQMGAAGSDKVAAADALALAKEAGADTTDFEAAIQTYEDNPTVENMLAVRSFANEYHQPKYERNYILDALCSPYFGVDDARWFAKQLNFKKFESYNSSLFDYISRYDIYDFGTRYEVPVGFISGSCDWVTPVSCARDYYEDIDAPAKNFEVIEGWGHSVPQENPQGFAETLEEVIGCLTLGL